MHNRSHSRQLQRGAEAILERRLRQRDRYSQAQNQRRALAEEFPDEKPLTKNAVAAIVRRSKESDLHLQNVLQRSLRWIPSELSKRSQNVLQK